MDGRDRGSPPPGLAPRHKHPDAPQRVAAQEEQSTPQRVEQVFATADQQNYAAVSPDLIDDVERAFSTPSAELTETVKRIFTPPRRRLVLVPRVDMRAVNCRVPRATERPRERRAGHGRARRTATTRDDGSSSDPEPAELGPQLDWRHPLAGKYAHGLVASGVRN